MASGSDHKNWWENLDWTLTESVQDTLEAGQRALRNLPSTLSAYKLNQPSPMDLIEPDPVEKLKRTAKQRPAPNAKFLAPPPKPACLQKPSAETPAAQKPAAEMPATETPALEKIAVEKPALEKKNLEKSQQLRAADVPPKLTQDKSDDVEETKRFTLEDLLTPDYDGYRA